MDIYKSRRYCLLMLVLVGLFPSGASAASMSEISAGLLVGMASPTYGKFNTIAKGRDEPGFPEMMLMTGGSATFASKGFMTGGRVAYGSTKSQSSTSGSVYTMRTFGFLAGYLLEMGTVDLSLSTMLGLGETNFSTGNASSGSSVQVEWLAVEPAVLLGLRMLPNFKVSVGYDYMYGMPHSVNQYGTSVLSSPTQASVGGTMYFIQLNFGFFN